eukprot:scaffold64201_cov58-Phaeocystis_antarctica.AAC.3
MAARVGGCGTEARPLVVHMLAALAEVEADAEAVGEAAGALDEDALGVELAVDLAAHAPRHRRLLAARGHLVRVRVRVRVRLGLGLGLGLTARGHPAQRRQARLEEQRRLELRDTLVEQARALVHPLPHEVARRLRRQPRLHRQLREARRRPEQRVHCVHDLAGVLPVGKGARCRRAGRGRAGGQRRDGASGPCAALRRDRAEPAPVEQVDVVPGEGADRPVHPRLHLAGDPAATGGGLGARVRAAALELRDRVHRHLDLAPASLVDADHLPLRVELLRRQLVGAAELIQPREQGGVNHAGEVLADLVLRGGVHRRW